MNKLDLIKKYVALQATDEMIWFEADTVTEAYLQKEIRRLNFLIEEATEEQIINITQIYARALMDG